MDNKPFNLVCLSCRNIYEGYYNNQMCPECGERETIRWMLKREFHITNPHKLTVENMKIKVSLKLKK